MQIILQWSLNFWHWVTIRSRCLHCLGDSMGLVRVGGTFPRAVDFVLIKRGVIRWILISSFSRAVSFVATRFVTSSTFLTFSLMLLNVACNCLLCLRCCLTSEVLSLSFSPFKHTTSSSKHLILIPLITWENWLASGPSALSKRETRLPNLKTLSRNAQTSSHTDAKARDFHAGTALASTLYRKKNIDTLNYTGLTFKKLNTIAIKSIFYDYILNTRTSSTYPPCTCDGVPDFSWAHPIPGVVLFQ